MKRTPLKRKTPLKNKKPMKCKPKRRRTKAESAHILRIKNMGCIACELYLGRYTSPCDAHHIRNGQGTSQRAPDFETIPLCKPHHQTGGHGVAIHAGQRTWEEKYGTERELLAIIMGRINQ